MYLIIRMINIIMSNKIQLHIKNLHKLLSLYAAYHTNQLDIQTITNKIIHQIHNNIDMIFALL